MDAQASSSRERLRAFVVGLTVACPYDQGNPDDCPLCSQRKKPFPERLTWLDSLSDDEVANIVLHHTVCLAAKEAGDIPPKSQQGREV